MYTGGIHKIAVDHLAAKARIEIFDIETGEPLAVLSGSDKMQGRWSTSSLSAIATSSPAAEITRAGCSQPKILREAMPMHVHEFNLNEVGNQIFTVGHEKVRPPSTQRALGQALGQAQTRLKNVPKAINSEAKFASGIIGRRESSSNDPVQAGEPGGVVWHSHADTDEAFIVIEGTLEIEFRDRTVTLNAGEMIVVPRGVEHRPIAREECKIMLLEPRGWSTPAMPVAA